MSSPMLVMQVCPPPHGPRRVPRMVWYLAGSLAVHLGAWAVPDATPPEESGVDVEWMGGEGTGTIVDVMTPVDVMPPDLPEPTLDLEHCDVRSDDWASCVLRAWNFGIPVDDTWACSDWGGCALGAEIPLRDYLMGPSLRDLNNPLYGLDGPCGVGSSGDHPPCGLPGAGVDPKLGFEIRGPRYRFAYHERPSRPSVVQMSRAIVTSASGYDRSIVRRYLRRHLDEIGACHEAPRLALHASAGDVAVTFFISPTGAVPVASGDGYDNNVARCVAKVIKTIQFPRPTDGGGVQVRAPFHFQAPRE